MNLFIRFDSFLKKILFIYFRERGNDGKKEGEKHVSEKHRSVASHKPPAGDLILNPGMCPDWEL